MDSATLYEPSFEHDSCGIGTIVSIDGNVSHKIVDSALHIVEKLEHRAGKDATGETGDGVGILVQISHRFFSAEAEKLGIEIGGARDYGVGMFFFPDDKYERDQAKRMFELLCEKENLRFLGWRKVPVNPDVLGAKARGCMPIITQCFIARPSGCEKGVAFDRKLYILRRQFEHSSKDTYVASLSSRTIVYKGMFLVHQLRTFYEDLQSELYESSLAIVHSRFSTNTFPSWKRAHPNRMIAHNGEINTIRGNADRMIAREETLYSSVLGDEIKKAFPVLDASGSDSAKLDNTLEFLVMNGLPLPLAMMICIPEPWKNDSSMPRAKKDFYHYWATMMEAWDGPAAVLFSDGDLVGATLDRNGLRPSRYYITKDNMLILASEVGVLDIPEENIVLKSRLMPGRILLVDTIQKRVISDKECKDSFAAAHPYGEWLDGNLLRLRDLAIPNKKIPRASQEERDRLYKAFGWNYEDVMEMVLPLAKTGVEPTGAMGVDTPLAVMSDKHPPLFSYFKQLFAQVTNPPIDSLREKIVTDTTVYIGSDGNILQPESKSCAVLEINNPILSGVDIMKIKQLNKTGTLKTAVVSLLYYKNTSLEDALDELFVSVEREYRNGSNIIILSDRGVDENHVAVPSLLAVSAISQYLIHTKKRTAVSIILETAEVRNVHQAAMILGYGARAVNPYLAHECISELIDKRILDKDYTTAINDFDRGVLNGIVKIAAKMGISTIQSYQSAQIFEAIGISKEVIDKYFTNTVSRVGGITLREIEDDVNFHHNRAFDPLGLTIDATLSSVGVHKMRRGIDAEDHLINPETIVALQEATRNGDYKRFKEYSAMIDATNHPHTLRALLDFNFPQSENSDTDVADATQAPIPIEEVEPASEIVKRFKTGAMSYGSISEEAHKCMAEAMNHLRGKSNSGEGGERPDRLGTKFNSAIKQVASGRFGVTEEYLLSAIEIQIKMAQGAKPGEGGHLPGKKVYPWIAKTRFATPGVSLISPPPHHDIYSIEDLAQLIYDLKNANRKARISVKLVSEAGVGTIAAGVAKAGAQVILISSHDGGTGAAPISSIHHAGLPWELGVAETHQTLIQNGLRSRVVIETDGKLMSGRDVAIACLLGAEEFGFATAPLITMGCAMMRVCNLDTCPFGVATQNERLRARFTGKPEYVENFMLFVAEEVREYMAKLGLRSMNEMVGRSDLLKRKEKAPSSRSNLVDLSRVLGGTAEHFRPEAVYDFKLEKTIDIAKLIPAFKKSLESGKKAETSISVSSTDRTTGTILGSEIQRKFKGNLEDDTFIVNCSGGGGQSFGAFIPKGLTLRLTGDANDYLGKGLSGGKIIVRPAKNAPYKAEENIIIGNVALYGATSGAAFIRGIAGERFCVRNSGATAVVEGCGDHGLEYMTGGIALILGSTGRNLAAGMSGGIAYVMDIKHDLYTRLNKQLVSMSELTENHDIETVRSLIEQHVKETQSALGKKILDDFENYVPHFKKIVPNDYRKMLNEISKAEQRGLSRDAAVLDAFRTVTA